MTVVGRGVVKGVVDALQLRVEEVAVVAGPERRVAAEVVEEVVVAHRAWLWLVRRDAGGVGGCGRAWHVSIYFEY